MQIKNLKVHTQDYGRISLLHSTTTIRKIFLEVKTFSSLCTETAYNKSRNFFNCPPLTLSEVVLKDLVSLYVTFSFFYFAESTPVSSRAAHVDIKSRVDRCL